MVQCIPHTFQQVGPSFPLPFRFLSPPGPNCPAQLVRVVPPHEEAWRGQQNTRDIQQPPELQVLPPSTPPHQHQQHPDDGHSGPGVHPVHRHQRDHEHVLRLPHHGHGQSRLPAQHRLRRAGGRRRWSPQRLLPARPPLGSDADSAAGAAPGDISDPGGSAVHRQALPGPGRGRCHLQWVEVCSGGGGSAVPGDLLALLNYLHLYHPHVGPQLYRSRVQRLHIRSDDPSRYAAPKARSHHQNCATQAPLQVCEASHKLGSCHRNIERKTFFPLTSQKILPHVCTRVKLLLFLLCKKRLTPGILSATLEATCGS